jgi:hypothetical protein
MSSITQGVELQDMAHPARPVTIGLVMVVLYTAGIVWQFSGLQASAAERDARQNERISAMERDQLLRGAQLDRIEGDIKELLKRVR